MINPVPRHTRNMRSTFKVVTAPTAKPIDVDHFKAWMRQRAANQGDDETNRFLELIIDSAIELGQKYTGRAFLNQTLQLKIDLFPQVRLKSAQDLVMELPMSPLVSITNIKYYDLDGTENTMDAGDYAIDIDNEPGLLSILTQPGVEETFRGIKITYVSGYGTAPENVPAPIRLAILEWAKVLYRQRDGVTPKSSNFNYLNIPNSVKAKLDPYVVRLI